MCCTEGAVCCTEGAVCCTECAVCQGCTESQLADMLTQQLHKTVATAANTARDDLAETVRQRVVLRGAEVQRQIGAERCRDVQRGAEMCRECRAHEL